jgi:two-component system cell cycle sensor histidine kinase/response regulator CckA
MKRTILVVDDAPAVRRMLTELLIGAGYEVLSAATFEEGKQLADAGNPDLMLIDIRLGDYNGLQLAVRERVNHPGRPVIVMTGHSDPVLEAEARRHGAEFVEKPLHPSRLIDMIKRMAPGDASN